MYQEDNRWSCLLHFLLRTFPKLEQSDKWKQSKFEMAAEVFKKLIHCRIHFFLHPIQVHSRREGDI